MMLVRGYRVKDIKEFEEENSVNILSYFNNISISNIIDLITLGNGRKCTREEAAEKLDEYLQDHSLEEAILEIKEALIGKGANTEEDVDNPNLMNIEKYNSLTELYEEYCMQLMSLGFGYSDFWDLSIKSMYRVFNSIVIKRENDTNKDLSIAHTQAALIGQAVWGKLQKKAPQVDLRQEQMINDMDADQALLVAKLATLMNKNRKKGEEIRGK